MSKLDPKTLSVGIIGFTGESGKALTTECLKNDVFKSTILIGRRNVTYNETFYDKGVQKVIDFDKLNDHDDVFKNLDVVYCCLGTTRGKAGADGFRKVDYDYVVNSAQVAKKNGVKQFHLVSSAGADKNSFFLYQKTKGQAEEAIEKLGFEKAAFYRPKLLLTDRSETRVAEKAFMLLTKPFQYLTPTLLSTPIETLAKSMIANTIFKSENEKSVIDNCKIFELAKLFDENFTHTK